MSLLDEKDLDKLWDEFDQFWSYKWCVKNAIEQHGIDPDDDFVLMTRQIMYTADERHWMMDNNIEHLPFELVCFIAYIVTTKERLFNIIAKLTPANKKDIYLVVKDDTNIDDAPPILKENFIITTYHSIRGKASGFHARS